MESQNRRKTILIIGAGAAGLAAGSALQAAGQRVILLEARNRIGGRVWTDRKFVSVPLENGAEFIHGDRVSTWQWVKALAAPTIPIPKYTSYLYEAEGQLHTYEQALNWQGFEQLPRLNQMLATVDAQERDRSFQDWLTELKLAPTSQKLIGKLIANSYLTEPENLSLADLVDEARVDQSGQGNFRLPEGYDQILNALSQGLAIELNTPVDWIDWRQTPLRVRATNALSHPVEFTADQILITVPLSLLQQQLIRFTPPLPNQKTEAIQALSMGAAVKLQLAFSEPFWPAEISLVVGTEAIPVWWSPGFRRPGFPAVLTAFVGGAAAIALNLLSETTAVEKGLADLCRLFSSDTPRHYFRQGRRISWLNDPWARGGYSYIAPGAFGARAILAHPLQERLFFAGEATVTDNNPGTVHGAISSGWRAAQEILERQAA